MGNYFSPYSLRVSEEIIEKMKVIAKKHKRSANKEMEYVLEMYISEFEKSEGKIILPDDMVE